MLRHCGVRVGSGVLLSVVWSILDAVCCREGSVSTKQIVFLQRPCLPQKLKKKESKVRGPRFPGRGLLLPAPVLQCWVAACSGFPGPTELQGLPSPMCGL